MTLDIEYLRLSLVDQQVCTSITDEAELVRRVNAELPTGLTGPGNDWAISQCPDHHWVICAENPDRRHYILSCGGFAEVTA